MKRYFISFLFLSSLSIRSYCMQRPLPKAPLLKPVSAPQASAKSILLEVAQSLQGIYNSLQVYLANRQAFTTNDKKVRNDFPNNLNSRIQALLELISAIPTEKQAIRNTVSTFIASLLAYNEATDDSGLAKVKNQLFAAMEAASQEVNIPWARVEKVNERQVTIIFNRNLNPAEDSIALDFLKNHFAVEHVDVISGRSNKIQFTITPVTDANSVVTLLNYTLIANTIARNKIAKAAQAKLVKVLPNNTALITFDRPLFDAEKALIRGILMRHDISSSYRIMFSDDNKTLTLTHDALDNPEILVKRINNILNYEKK